MFPYFKRGWARKSPLCAAVLLSVFSLLSFSCDESEREFWALDDTGKVTTIYALDAELKAQGKHSKIWVEKGLEDKGYHVSPSVWADLAAEYDNQIRPKLLDAFSVKGPVRDPDTQKVVGQNSLDWADYLTGGDGKLSILILDIPTDNPEYYTAGYFWPINFYKKNDTGSPDYKYSNETAMLYMDIRTLLERPLEFKMTMAHETQHLINFANSQLLRRQKKGNTWYFDEMDLWINEGLSAAAEYVYSGQHNAERLGWFSGCYVGSARNRGNNFFVWGEKRDESQAILDEYATVYFFFHWLRLQSGKTHDIYKNISTSEYADHRAVLNALKGKGNYGNDNNLQWGTLLRDWLLANLLATSDGTLSASPKHGYEKEPALSAAARICLHPNAGSDNASLEEVSLYPGEGVYSWVQGAQHVSNHGNIKYAGAIYSEYASNSGAVSDNEIQPLSVLLSYNTNTVKAELETQTQWEPAYVSTDLLPPSAKSSYAKKSLFPARSSLVARPSKPQAISLWDLIRMKEQRKAQEAQAAESTSKTED